MSEFLQYLNELEEKTKQAQSGISALGGIIDAVGKESGNIDKLARSFEGLTKVIQRIGKTKVNIDISGLVESVNKTKSDITDLTAALDRLQSRVNDVFSRTVEIKVSAVRLNEVEETLRNIYNLSSTDFTNINQLVRQLRALSRLNVRLDSIVQLKEIIDQISASPVTIRVENSRDFTETVQQAQRLRLLLQDLDTYEVKPKVDFSFLLTGIEHTERLLTNIRSIESSFAALQTSKRGRKSTINIDIQNLQELEKLSKQTIIIPVVLDIQNRSEIESLTSRVRAPLAEGIEPLGGTVSLLRAGGVYSGAARLSASRQSIETLRSASPSGSDFNSGPEAIYKKVRELYNTSIFVFSTFGEIFNAYDRFNQSFQSFGQFHPATVILGIGGMAKALTAFTKLTLFAVPSLRNNTFLSGFTEDTAKTFAQLVEGFVAGFSGVNINEIRTKMRKAAVEAKLNLGSDEYTEIDVETISEQVKQVLGGRPRTPINMLIGAAQDQQQGKMLDSLLGFLDGSRASQISNFILQIQNIFDKLVKSVRAFVVSLQGSFGAVFSSLKNTDQEKILEDTQKRVRDIYDQFGIDDSVIQQYTKYLASTAEVFPKITEGSLQINKLVNDILRERGTLSRSIVFSLSKEKKDMIRLSDEIARLYGAKTLQEIVGSTSGLKGLHRSLTPEEHSKQTAPVHFVGAVLERGENAFRSNMFTTTHELGHAFDYIARAETGTGSARFESLASKIDEATKDMFLAFQGDLKDEGRLKETERRIRVLGLTQRLGRSESVFETSLHHTAGWGLVDWEDVQNLVARANKTSLKNLGKSDRDFLNVIKDEFDYFFNPNEIIANIFSAKARQDTKFERYLRNLYSEFTVQVQGQTYSIYDLANKYVEDELGSYVTAVRDNITSIEDALNLAMGKKAERAALDGEQIVGSVTLPEIGDVAQLLLGAKTQGLGQVAQNASKQQIVPLQNQLKNLINTAADTYYRSLVKEWYDSAESVVDILKAYAAERISERFVVPRIKTFLYEPRETVSKVAKSNIFQSAIASPTAWNILTSQYLEATQPRAVRKKDESEIRKDFISRTGLAVSDLQLNKLRDLSTGLLELEASATLADGSIASLNYTVDQWGRVTLKKAAGAFDEFTKRISFRVIGELFEEGVEELIFYFRNTLVSILKTQSSFQEVGAFLGLDARTFQVGFAKNLAAVAFETGQTYTKSVEAALKNVELFNKFAPTSGASGVLQQAEQFTRLQLAATTVFELTDEGMVADIPSIYRQLESRQSSDIPIEERSQRAMATMERLMDYMIVAQRKTGADPRNIINTYAGLASSIGKLNISSKELIAIAATSDVSLAESQEEKYNTLKLLLERIVLSENRRKLREYGLNPDKNLYQLILDIYRLSQTPETMGQYQRTVSEIGGAARANQVAQIIQSVGKDFELGSNSILASLEQISGSEFERSLERNVNTLQNTINKIDAAFMSFLNTILFGSGAANVFVQALEKIPRLLNALEFVIQSVINTFQTAFDFVTGIMGITSEGKKEDFINNTIHGTVVSLLSRSLLLQDSGRARFNLFSWIPEKAKSIENKFRAFVFSGSKSSSDALPFGELRTRGTIGLAKRAALFFIDEMESREKQGMLGRRGVESALQQTVGNVQRLIVQQPQLLRGLSDEQQRQLKASPIQFVEQSILSALGTEDAREKIRELEDSTIKTQVVHQQIVHNVEQRAGIRSGETIERRLRGSRIQAVDKENLNATRKFIEELKQDRTERTRLHITPTVQENRTSRIEKLLAGISGNVPPTGKKYEIMRGVVTGVAEGALERSGALSARERMWQRLGTVTDILSVAIQEGLFYGAMSKKEDAMVNGVVAGLGAAIGGALFGPAGLMFGAEVTSSLANMLDVQGRIGLSSNEARSISSALEKFVLGEKPEDKEKEIEINAEVSKLRKELNFGGLIQLREQQKQAEDEQYKQRVRTLTQFSSMAGAAYAAAYHPDVQKFLQGVGADYFGWGKQTPKEQVMADQTFMNFVQSNEKLNALFQMYMEGIEAGEIQVTDAKEDFLSFVSTLSDAEIEALIQKKQQIEEEVRFTQALKDAAEALDQASVGLKQFKDMLDVAYQQKPFGGLTYGQGGTAMLALQDEYLKRLSAGQNKEQVDQWFQQNQKKVTGFEEFANVLFTAGMVGGAPPNALQMQKYMESYMRLDEFGEQYVTDRLKTYTELMAFVGEYEQKQAELNYLQAQNYDVSKEEYKQVKERIDALQKELELHKLRYDMSVKALGAAKSEKDFITKTIADVEKLQGTRKPRLIREGTPAQFVAPNIVNIEEMGAKGFLEAVQYAREKQAKLIAFNPEYRKKFAEEQFLVETPYGFRKVAGIDQSFVNEYMTKIRSQMPETVDLRQYSREQVTRAVERAKELQLKVVEMAPEMAKTFDGKRLLLMAKNNDLLMETNLSQEYLRMALEENTKSNELRGHYNLPSGYQTPTIWDYYNEGGTTAGEENYPTGRDGMVSLEFAQKLAQELAKTKAQGSGTEDIGDIIEPGAAPFFYPKPGTPAIFEKIETDKSVIDVATAIFPNLKPPDRLKNEKMQDTTMDSWQRSWWITGGMGGEGGRPIKDFIPDVYKFFSTPLQPTPVQSASPPKTRAEPINVNIDMRFTGTNVKLAQKPDVRGPRGRSTVVTLTANSEDGM